MFKSFLKFCLGFMLLHTITYFLAELAAQTLMGAKEYYPPSPQALSYFRDPMSSFVQIWFLPAQMLRGLLYALALFPFRRKIVEMGQVLGGLSVTGIILLIGYVAATGGLIEHFIYFSGESYPLRFAVITLMKIFVQTLLLGQLLVWWERRFNKKYYNSFFW